MTTAIEKIRGHLDAIDALLDELEPLPAPPRAGDSEAEGAARYFPDDDAYGAFFDWLRDNKMLGPKISESEFKGCDAIIAAFGAEDCPVSFVAYGLATAYLETAQTMQPIKEYGGAAYFTRMYDIKGARPAKARELGNLTPGDGAKYCGRGYVQLTGKANYAKATAKLGNLGFSVDLVAEPDRAMEPEIAAAVMVLGMTEGWFTGRKLSDDLPARGPATLAQFTTSRDIINGKDKQAEIAGYANDFQTALQEGGYRP